MIFSGLPCNCLRDARYKAFLVIFDKGNDVFLPFSAIVFYGLISTGAALMNDRLYPDCRFELDFFKIP